MILGEWPERTEHNQNQRKEVRADIETEQRLEQLLTQPVAISADDPSESSISKLTSEMHTVSRLPSDFQDTDRHVESKTTNGVAEVIFKSLDSELLEQARVRSSEPEMPKPLVENKPDETRRKKQPKERQKKRVKDHNRDIEM